MDQAQKERGAAYLERVRALGPAIEAAAGDTESLRELPAELLSALIEADLFRLVLAREYGGAELAPPDLLAIVEEVAGHDASTAWCLGQNNICAVIAAHMEPEAAALVFDGPATTLAWGPGPGEARAVDGGYLVSGKFDFASGSRHATWLGAHLPVIENGEKRLTKNGAPALFTLLFPRADCEVEDTWQVIGLKGTGSDSYRVEELFVPQERCVERLEKRMPKVPGRLYVFSQSNLYAPSFAAIALGIARATHEAFIAGIRDTVPRGAGKTRGSNNVVQATVGRNEARLGAARSFLYGTVGELWQVAQTADSFTLEQQSRLRLAATWAIGEARDSVSELYIAAGALAIFESQPFERRFRDIHTVSQQIQGHGAHFETVGQILMGLEPDRSIFTF